RPRDLAAATMVLANLAMFAVHPWGCYPRFLLPLQPIFLVLFAFGAEGLARAVGLGPDRARKFGPAALALTLASSLLISGLAVVPGRPLYVLAHTPGTPDAIDADQAAAFLSDPTLRVVERFRSPRDGHRVYSISRIAPAGP